MLCIIANATLTVLYYAQAYYEYETCSTIPCSRLNSAMRARLNVHPFRLVHPLSPCGVPPNSLP